MKSLKTLIALGCTLAFSSSVFAETANPLNTMKAAAKETATTQMTQQANQVKQAVTSAQNSAKSTITAKTAEATSATKTAVTSAKEKVATSVSSTKANIATAQEKASTVKNATEQTSKTARDTLNSAKNTATEKASSSVKATAAKKGKININTADVETLQALDGIGEAKAKAIVEYRKKHGAFKKASDLTKVSGIGEATLNNIKSSISIQ